MKVRYGHRGRRGEYKITFTIGVQTFTLDSEAESLQVVKWYHKMLRHAFKNFKNNISEEDND